MSKYWDDLDFIAVVKNSSSIADVLRHYKLLPHSTFYRKIFNKDIKRLNISTTHFNHFKNINKKLRLDNIFIKNSKASRSTLKRRVLKDNLLQNICNNCNMPPEWCNKSLSLHLDYINGIYNDNRVENLRLLCSNCHSQTSMYSGRNIKKNHIKSTCKICNIIVGGRKTKHCRSCFDKFVPQKTKKIWPEPKIVKQMVDNSNYVKVGAELGVSDNSVRKFLKKHKLL